MGDPAKWLSSVLSGTFLHESEREKSMSGEVIRIQQMIFPEDEKENHKLY